MLRRRLEVIQVDHVTPDPSQRWSKMTSTPQGPSQDHWGTSRECSRLPFLPTSVPCGHPRSSLGTSEGSPEPLRGTPGRVLSGCTCEKVPITKVPLKPTKKTHLPRLHSAISLPGLSWARPRDSRKSWKIIQIDDGTNDTFRCLYEAAMDRPRRSQRPPGCPRELPRFSHG